MARDQRWTQTTLLPAEAVDGVLRIGVVGAGDHGQVQIELRNATDGELLVMESTPHVRLSRLDAAAHEALDRLLNDIATHAGPF